jgi:hypothetical protein
MAQPILNARALKVTGFVEEGTARRTDFALRSALTRRSGSRMSITTRGGPRSAWTGRGMHDDRPAQKR